MFSSNVPLVISVKMRTKLRSSHGGYVSLCNTKKKGHKTGLRDRSVTNTNIINDVFVHTPVMKQTH